MKIITILISMILLAGCGDNDKIEQAKEAVSFKLIDGISAQFYKVEFKDLLVGGEVVCGYVNSKNIKGNYTGNSRFIYKLEGATLELEPTSRKAEAGGDNLVFNFKWESTCSSDVALDY